MTVLDLTTLTLTAGMHKPGSDKMCLLEGVSYIAGEPWSDHPECVSPVLSAYGRSLNDALPYETRQRLVPLIPRLLNTAGDGLDGQRSYMALDWLTRTYLPTWLRLVPAFVGQADLLSATPEVTDLATATVVSVLVREAASQAEDAWAAAGNAEGYPVGYAARAAARAVAERAARAAAGAAAERAAVEATAWVADGAARDAGWDTTEATWIAVRHAAWIAIWTAAEGAAVDAAWTAAEAFLAPTVAVLQDSAIDLFDRMLTVTK